MKTSLEGIRALLFDQMLDIPEQLEVVRTENGRDLLFMLDVRGGALATAVMDNAPADWDLEKVRAEVLSALTVDMAVLNGMR